MEIVDTILKKVRVQNVQHPGVGSVCKVSDELRFVSLELMGSNTGLDPESGPRPRWHGVQLKGLLSVSMPDSQNSGRECSFAQSCSSEFVMYVQWPQL